MGSSFHSGLGLFLFDREPHPPKAVPVARRAVIGPKTAGQQGGADLTVRVRFPNSSSK